MRDVNLQVKYVARWAESVLRLGEGLVPDIPLAGTQSFIAGRAFQLSLPDLADDPLAGTPDHPGELRILARDRATGKVIAQLIPTDASLRTRLGGLQIRKAYPDPIEFAFCASPGLGLRDANGFAIRPPKSDTACDR
jgi:hypothetical protein